MALELQPYNWNMATSHNRIPNKIAGVLCARIFVAVVASIWLTSASVTAPAEIQREAASHRAPSQKRGIVTRTMILEAQERLIELGYWIGETEGKWGEASRSGLIAFQKVEGRPRTGKLTAAELEALNAASRPSPLERGSAHIEVDLKRQVLFVVDAGGAISRILPVSTGDGKMFTVDDYTQPAVTPTGRFHVYRKLPGWRKSPLDCCIIQITYLAASRFTAIRPFLLNRRATAVCAFRCSPPKSSAR